MNFLLDGASAGINTVDILDWRAGVSASLFDIVDRRNNNFVSRPINGHMQMLLSPALCSYLFTCLSLLFSHVDSFLTT